MYPIGIMFAFYMVGHFSTDFSGNYRVTGLEASVNTVYSLDQQNSPELLQSVSAEAVVSYFDSLSSSVTNIIGHFSLLLFLEQVIEVSNDLLAIHACLQGHFYLLGYLLHQIAKVVDLKKM